MLYSKKKIYDCAILFLNFRRKKMKTFNFRNALQIKFWKNITSYISCTLKIIDIASNCNYGHFLCLFFSIECFDILFFYWHVLFLWKKCFYASRSQVVIIVFTKLLLLLLLLFERIDITEVIHIFICHMLTFQNLKSPHQRD